MRVVVVGAGIAGTAAALAARSAGADVTVVNGGSGASTLATGALDRGDWELGDPPAPFDERAAAVLEALEMYTVPDRGVVVATTAGILRAARGADRALLDLETIEQGAVLVPRCDHPSWDAGALAAAWSASPRAELRALSFTPADAPVLRMTDERALPDADLAARHDDPARLAWLADRLRDAIARRESGVVGVLLPPWLGLDRPRADALSSAVGVPCGEAIGLPGGPSGLRFERARDRAFARAEIAVVRGKVTGVERNGDGWRAVLHEAAPRDGDAIVIATGGLVGGGLTYTPSASILAGPLPPGARPTVQPTVEGPLPIGADGSPLPLPASLFGIPPEALAWPLADRPLLERAGVLTGEDGRVAGESALFAAGEVAADRPRTWIDALLAGERAGVAACLRERAHSTAPA